MIRLALLWLAVVSSGGALAAETIETVPLDSGWLFHATTVEWAGPDLPAVPDDPSIAWEPLEDVGRGDVLAAEQAWLRRSLPRIELADPGLYLWSNRAIFAIFLDREPIYWFGLEDPGGEREGWTWHFVPLPADASGRSLHVWGPDPVPDSLSAPAWLIVPQSQAGLLVSRALKRTVALELDELFFGSVLIMIGLVAAAIYWFRGRRRDLAPIYFAAFAILYGARLLAQTSLFNLATDLPPLFWQRTTTFLTYAINVPSTLFFEQFYGRGWKSTIRRLWQLQLVYAIVAIAADLVTGGIGVAMFANSYLVLLGMVIALGHVFGPRVSGIPEAPVFKASFLVLAIFVVNENLVGAGLVPWQSRPEAIGFFIFLCGLGYALAQRVMANENKLASVERELATARQIQASILPPGMPRVGNLELAARYQPVASVAGDFYDFMRVGDKGLGVLVADVAGHGVPAALIASMVKATFSAQSVFAEEPARLLSEMNRNLCGSLERRFVTAGYLYVDTSRSVATYASAGHPPPWIRTGSDGTLGEIEARGPILGRFREADYAAETIPIEAGDRIYLFTDGILEAAGTAGEQFGEERFRRFIEANHQLAPDAFADRLLESVSAWSDGSTRPELEDDLTLIVVAVQDG